MFNNPFFDTAISLVTLYLIFSQLTLSLVELPAGVLNTRGTYLHNRLREALGPALHTRFYDAATISALALPRAQKNWLLSWVSLWPSYISETLFAQTIVACVTGTAAGATPIARFGAGLAAQPAGGFTDTLQILYANALSVGGSSTPEAQSVALQRNLETWFHDFGGRLTGWYKRDSRKYLFMMGLAVAILADVDTVRLARFIGDSSNAAIRLALAEAGVRAAQGTRPVETRYNPTEAVASQATASATGSLLPQADSLLKSALAAVPAAGLPLGLLRWAHPDALRAAGQGGYTWAPTADDFGMPAYAQRWRLDAKTGKVSLAQSPWYTWGGWLLTAFAMMIGAPFWFDTLCRFVNIRNVGTKPPRPAAS